MTRRTPISVLLSVVVVSVLWVAAQTWWTWSALQVLFRGDAETPTVATALVQSADVALPFVGLVLLGAALVLAGLRWWALGTVVLLNLAEAGDLVPVGGSVLTSTHITDPAGIPAGWPWTEIALHVVLALVPVVVGWRTTPRRATGLRASAIGALAVLVSWALWDPGVLAAPEGGSTVRAAAAVVVVLATGVLAAAVTPRVLLGWVATFVVLVALRTALRGQVFTELYGTGWSDADLLGTLVHLAPVLVGPLGAPWLRRRWVATFRAQSARGAVTE